MEKYCKHCKILFGRNPKYSRTQWEKATYCSNSCRQSDRKITPEIIEHLRRIASGRKQSLETKIKRGIYKTGGNHYLWKGGISIDKASGYLRDNKSKRRIHRKIVEEHLGRKLKTWEQVHHIDGDKTNNDISNLIVLSRSEHTKVHWEIGTHAKQYKEVINI